MCLHSNLGGLTISQVSCPPPLPHYSFSSTYPFQIIMFHIPIHCYIILFPFYSSVIMKVNVFRKVRFTCYPGLSLLPFPFFCKDSGTAMQFIVHWVMISRISINYGGQPSNIKPQLQCSLLPSTLFCDLSPYFFAAFSVSSQFIASSWTRWRLHTLQLSIPLT